MKKFFLLIFIIGLSLGCYYLYDNYFKVDELKKFLKNVEKEKLNIDKYYVYGRHLNFESKLIDGMNKDNLKIVLKSKNDEIEYDLNINDNSFNLSDNINEGINLEELNDSVYYILLKETNNEKVKYYSFNETLKSGLINLYDEISGQRLRKYIPYWA